MNKVYITPYNMGSESAKNLAHSLGVLRTEGKKLFKHPTTIVNWGRRDLRIMGRRVTVLNKSDAVIKAADKLQTFRTFAAYNIPTVEHTTNSEVARQWVAEGHIVYGRRYTDSSQGRGIVILTQDERFVSGLPLYTKGVYKAHEYRVHVFKGEVIDYSKKKQRSGVESNSYIKNYDNGWVFCRDGVSLPNKVADACVKAVAALGLDFGAVDVGYREKENNAYVYEVNTAPGIEGTTLQKYKEKICQLVYPPQQNRIMWGLR